MTEMLGPYQLGPNDTPENGIYTGDARELAKEVPGTSIGLIFTDPVYDRTEDYLWLARTSERLLMAWGALLVWSNGKWHHDHACWLENAGAFYRWTFACVNANSSAPMNGKIIAKTNRMIWLDWDDRSKMRTYLPDGYLSIGGIWDIPKANCSWGKSNRFTASAIRCFADDSDIVLDPFTGGGTVPAVCKMLGRRYLAFEIDPATAETARERVRNTQPPLFVPQPEQRELGL